MSGGSIWDTPGQTSDGSSGNGGGSIWGSPAPVQAPSSNSGGHGFLGFVEHLGSDAKNAIEGLPTGAIKVVGAAGHDLAKVTAEHPWLAATNPFSTAALGITKLTGQPHGGYELPQIGKGIGKSYEQEYSPLFHGKFGQFAHDFYAHPLGPILDALTVATLGAGGVAKAGSLLERAGMLAPESRLANLGKATDLTVPDVAKAAGQKGEDIVIKQTSRNPLIRLRQTTVHNALNNLPSETPLLGSTSRGTRALMREPERAAASLQGEAQKFSQDFAKLNKVERAAWHLKARAIKPADYAAHLSAQGEKASKATLRLLKDPQLAEMMKNPSEKLQTALASGRSLSEHLTALKVAGGHLPETTALESPYRHLRILNGATRDAEGKLVDEPGREIEALMQELHDRGEEQPFHVTDSPHVPGGKPNPFARRPAGFSAPKHGVKESQGVLFDKGLINLTHNSLASSYRQFASEARAQMIHDELVKHAAELPKGEPIPRGYEELKLNRGQAATPFTQRISSNFEHVMSEPTLREKLAGLALHDVPEAGLGEQKRFVVPSRVKSIIESKSGAPRTNVWRVTGIPQATSLWKHLVLGLRPAFFGNITVGNSILATLQMAPGRWGVLGWLNQVLPGFEKIAGSRLSEETMGKHFPEQRYGTFGHSMFGDKTPSTNRLVRAGQKLSEGVMPATIGYENVLRRAMAEGWAKATPEVQAIMRRNGGDVNEALKEVAQAKPQIIHNISRRIDDALGNYRSYNSYEQALKAIVPFYGWNRHLTASVARLALEHPARLDALVNTGETGEAKAQAIVNGLAKYLQGSVGVHLPSWLGGKNGDKQLLTMASLNPFNTLTDEGEMLKALVDNQPGSLLTQDSQTWPLNPFFEAGLEQMTGTNLLTGNPFPKGSGNAIGNEILHATPQQSLLHDLIYGRHPSPQATNQNGEYAQLLRLLGIPVENVGG